MTGVGSTASRSCPTKSPASRAIRATILRRSSKDSAEPIWSSVSSKASVSKAPANHHAVADWQALLLAAIMFTDATMRIPRSSFCLRLRLLARVIPGARACACQSRPHDDWPALRHGLLRRMTARPNGSALSFPSRAATRRAESRGTGGRLVEQEAVTLFDHTGS